MSDIESEAEGVVENDNQRENYYVIYFQKWWPNKDKR
jgi:hypothetical protein